MGDGWIEGGEVGENKVCEHETGLPRQVLVIKGCFFISRPAACKIELCLSAYKLEL